MARKGLDSWLQKLTKQNMPVVGQVIAELNTLTGKADADFNHLAEVILKDPNMTSHVLRIANSVHYNYSSFPINTVSRAIVLIGLKGMRSICISVLLIDALLSKSPKDHLLRLMAQAILAATQARDLMKLHNDSMAEEVFIAALLYNLGEMAFLATEPLNDGRADLFSHDTGVRRAAMERELGTSFKAITKGLARHWKLGETLELALFPGNEPETRVQAVVLGERMSRALQSGWDSDPMDRVLDDFMAFTGTEREGCLALIQKSSEKAAEVAVNYGASQVCGYLPSRVMVDSMTASTPDHGIGKVLRSDAQLQLNILRELSTAAAEKADVNTLFQIVIEGMHRGIGLERVVIAFINNRRARAKYALGEGAEHWRREFDFDVSPAVKNIFTHAIRNGGTTWIDQAFMSQHDSFFTPDILRVVGKNPSLIYVVEVGDRTPALFYADRNNLGGVIGKDQVESFRHFAAQTQISLNMLSHLKQQRN